MTHLSIDSYLNDLKSVREKDEIITPEPFLTALEQVSQAVATLVEQDSDESHASLNNLGEVLSTFLLRLSLFAVDKNLVETRSLFLLTNYVKSLTESLTSIRTETLKQINESISFIEEKGLWDELVIPQHYSVDIEV